MKKRKVGVMLGSESDFAQCYQGLQSLINAANDDYITLRIFTDSIHRDHDGTIKNLTDFSAAEYDFIIVGAGKAAHLPGMVDSYLRYTLRDDRTVVVAVAFENRGDPQDTMAAIYSIDKVPGHQMVFNRDKYIGPDGFTNACRFVLEHEPPAITLPKAVPAREWSWEEALKRAEELARANGYLETLETA